MTCASGGRLTSKFFNCKKRLKIPISSIINLHPRYTMKRNQYLPVRERAGVWALERADAGRLIPVAVVLVLPTFEPAPARDTLDEMSTLLGRGRKGRALGVLVIAALCVIAGAILDLPEVATLVRSLLAIVGASGVAMDLSITLVGDSRIADGRADLPARLERTPGVSTLAPVCLSLLCAAGNTESRLPGTIRGVAAVRAAIEGLLVMPGLVRDISGVEATSERKAVDGRGAMEALDVDTTDGRGPFKALAVFVDGRTVEVRGFVGFDTREGRERAVSDSTGVLRIGDTSVCRAFRRSGDITPIVVAEPTLVMEIVLLCLGEARGRGAFKVDGRVEVPKELDI